MRYIFGVLGVFVLIVIGLVFYSSSIISTAITKIGTEALGVPVHVQNVDLSFLKGEAKITGLSVDNPEKYKNEKAVSLGEIYVKLNTKSLMSNKVMVESVRVSAPEVFYESDLKSSNLKDIQNNLAAKLPKKSAQSKTDAQQQPEAAEQPASSSHAKLQIDSFLIEKAAMHMQVNTPAGEKKYDVNIPKIEIKGIGAKGDGASPEQVMQIVVAPFLGQIQNSAVSLIKKEGFNGAMDQMKEKGNEALERIRNLF